MRGLVLEGGGARGAFQAGAIKALNKKGIYFDAAVGTSIGSINAAMYASKNTKDLFKLWLEVDSKDLFDIDGKLLSKISTGKFNKMDLKKGFSTVVKVVKNKGIDTSRIKNYLREHLNEDDLKNSNIDYGLVTYNLSDFKPVQIYKKDIPKGKLIDYIIASSYLPVFKFEKIIDDKYYFDGGIYANCPIDMFLDKDIDEIYVIRAWRSKLKYNTKKKVKVHVIAPKRSLGSIMAFEPALSKDRFNYGYYETLKYIDKLDGNHYYFKRYGEEYYNKLFDKRTFRVMMRKYGKLMVFKNKKQLVLKVIEKVCDDLDIERFKVYNMPYLLMKLKFKMYHHKDSPYYDFIKKIKIDFN